MYSEEVDRFEYEGLLPIGRLTMIQLFATLIESGFTVIDLLFVDYWLSRTTTLVCERS